MSAELLLQEAHRLSVADRLRLVEEIWDSIGDDPASLPISHEQREELDSRLADYEANPSAGSPWNDVRARIENRP